MNESVSTLLRHDSVLCSRSLGFTSLPKNVEENALGIFVNSVMALCEYSATCGLTATKKFFEHVLFIQKESEKKKIQQKNIMGSFCTTCGSRCIQKPKECLSHGNIRSDDTKVCILNAMSINH